MGLSFKSVTGLTGKLVGTLRDYKVPFGLDLTLLEKIQALNPVAWYDSQFAQSKIAARVGDGVTDEYLLNTGSPKSFVFGNGSTDQPFSIGFCFQRVNAGGIIATTHDGSNFDWYISNFSGRVYIELMDRNAAGNYLAVRSSLITTQNFWYYCLITYDGTGTEAGIKMYFADFESGSDTELVETSLESYSVNEGSYVAMGGQSTQLILGNRNWSSAAQFDARYDQFVIWSKELSLAEGNVWCNETSGLNYKDLVGDESFYDDIVAWYDFNAIQNFGRNYAGESHAVDIGGGTDTLTSNSSDFNFNYSDPFSIGFWIKPTATGNQSWLGHIEGAPDYTGYQFLLRNTDELQVYFVGINGASEIIKTTDSVNFAVNQWYHVIVTYSGNGLASGINIYVNGVLAAATATRDDLSSTSIQTTADFQVGRNWSSSGNAVFDEVFVYSDELTPSEATTLYNNGIVAEASTLHSDNLVSSWSFNEQDATEVGKDQFGSNDLTPVSIVEGDLVGGVKDARTQYRELDGSGDYFTCTTSDFLLDGGSGPRARSFLFEVEYDSISSGYLLLPAGSNDFILAISSGKMGFYIQDDASSSNYNYRVTTDNFVINKRYAILFVYDGTDAPNPETGVTIYYANLTDGDTTFTAAAGYTDTVVGTFVSHTSTNTAMEAWGRSAVGAKTDGSAYHFSAYDSILGTDVDTSIIDTLISDGTVTPYVELSGSEGFYSSILSWYDYENVADLGKDETGNNHFAVVGTTVGGPAREGSLDLLEVSIDSSNAVQGHISGKAGDWDGVNNWADRSGNSNDASQATLANTPIVPADLLNDIGVVKFNGTSETLELGTPISFGDSITDEGYLMSFLVKLDKTTSNTFFTSGNTGVNFGVFFGINSGGVLNLNQRDQDASPANSISISKAALFFSLDTWYHFAVRYTGTKGAGEWSLYVNGVKLTGLAESIGADYVAVHSSDTSRLGNQGITGTSYFGGEMAHGFVTKGNFTDADVTLLNDYYNETYNLTLS